MDSAEPASTATTCSGTTTAPARCPELPPQQDRAARHLHAGRRLHPGPDHRVRPRARQRVARRSTRTARPARTGARRVRQPLRQARRRRQRRRTTTRSSSSTSSARSSASPRARRARGGQRLRHADRHAEGAARRRRQRRLSVRAEPSALASRTSTATAAATRAGSSKAPTPRTPATTATTACQFIEEGLLSNARRRRALLPGPGQQPHRLARQLRRAPPATSRICAKCSIRRRSCRHRSSRTTAASRAGRRVAERLPHVQRRWTTTRVDVAANWSMFSTTGGRPTQYQVRRRLRRAHARLPVAPVPLHPDRRSTRTAPPLRQPDAAARGALHRRQHRHRVPLQRGDPPGRRLRRRPDDDRRLRHGRHRALGAARRLDRRRAGRELRAGRSTLSTRSACSCARSPRRTRTPTSSRRSTSCRRSARTRTSASATARRSTGPSSASWRAFEFTDVVGSRAVTGQSGSRRALIQNVDARWEMFPGGRERARRQRLLQVLRPADRARRHRRRAADRHVPERRQGPQLRHRARSRPRARPTASSSTPTTRSSTRRSRCCPSSSTVQTSLERPLAGQSKNLFNLMAEYTHGRLLGPRAGQLLRRPHLRRRRQPGARHHRAGPRRRVDLVCQPAVRPVQRPRSRSTT